MSALLGKMELPDASELEKIFKVADASEDEHLDQFEMHEFINFLL